MIPWKTTALHLLLHLTGLQAQETAHLLTLASLHLVFSSASQVIQALMAVFIVLASEETWRKQGGKDRRHPRRGARKATRKAADHIFQKAEIPTSIRTCCLSNRSSWQTQLTSLEKMSVLIEDRGKENQKWKRRESSKEQELCKNRRQEQRPFVFPSYEKVMPTQQRNNYSEGHLGIFAPYRSPGELLQEKCLTFPRSLSLNQKYK